MNHPFPTLSDKTDYRNNMGDGSNKYEKIPFTMGMAKPVQLVDNIEDDADRVGYAARQKPKKKAHLRQDRFETADVYRTNPSCAW